MSLNKEALGIYCIIVILFSFLYSDVESEGAEFSIKPLITLSEEYDNNIFLTNDNKVDDFITRIIPSISLTCRTPIWELTLKDELQWWYYAKQGNDYYSNNADLSSKLTVINDFFYFDVTDINSNVVLNPRGPSTDINLNVNRTNTNDLNASPYIKYQIDPITAATTGFRYTNIWYQQDGINRQQYTGYLNLEHAFTPNLKALLGAEYVADRPENVEPNDNQTAPFLSLFYTLSPRMKFEGTFGYRWIRFSNNFNFDSTFYNAGLSYELPEKGQIQLRASQAFSDSPTQGIVKNVLQQLLAKYGEALSINGSLYHTRDVYFQLGETNEGMGVTAGVTYTPNPRMTYSISGKYEKDNFLPQDQKRNVSSASAAIYYKLTAKATLGLSDAYNKSTGNTDLYEYTDNIVKLEVKIEL